MQVPKALVGHQKGCGYLRTYIHHVLRVCVGGGGGGGAYKGGGPGGGGALSL